MTDKQIIIDGVDVSECKLFRNGICASPINSKCKLCIEINEKMCYYKQLKAKEQECERLTSTLAEIKEISEKLTDNYGHKVTNAKIIIQKISEGGR